MSSNESIKPSRCSWRLCPSQPTVTVIALAFAAVAALLGFPLLGRTVYSPHLYWGMAFAANVPGEGSDPSVLILSDRLVNTTAAMAAGGGLAVAGLMLQTLFRNPLASPFTLGIAGGASFGASLWICIVSSFVPALASSGISGGFGICLGAFLGAVLAMFTVYALGRNGGVSSERILLSGIAVNFFFSGLILFVQYLSEQGRSFRMLRWTMGEIDLADPVLLWPLVLLVAAGGILLFLFSREMDILLTGEERAMSLGMNLSRFRLFLFFLSSLLVAAVVSICGPIGFVGLMAPHFARLLVGGGHRRLIPASLLFGAVFLAACFTAARTILFPNLLPVGVITSLLGGPFFLWLLLRR